MIWSPLSPLFRLNRLGSFSLSLQGRYSSSLIIFVAFCCTLSSSSCLPEVSVPVPFPYIFRQPSPGLPPSQYLATLWPCPCSSCPSHAPVTSSVSVSPLRIPGSQKGTCSGKGKNQLSGECLEHPVWEGDKKGWEKKSFVQQWEFRSQNISCKQLTWVKNASAGFGAASCLCATGLFLPLQWSFWEQTWVQGLWRWCSLPRHVPQPGPKQETALQPQPVMEVCSSLGCSLPPDPCNFLETIISWTSHYGQNLGKCFSTGYDLCTCLSSLASTSFQSAVMVPEIAEDVTSRSPAHTGNEAAWWTQWNQHHDSWKQHESFRKHPQPEPGSICNEHEYFRTHLQNALTHSFYNCIRPWS